MTKDKQARRCDQNRIAGFTLVELIVVVAVGAVLSGMLMADLTQTRTTLLRQACAANLKHWGMAIELYAQDYSGTYFYALGSTGWNDGLSPYYRYIGGGDRTVAMRTMRICPAVAARLATQSQSAGSTFLATYSMPVAMEKVGGAYQDTSAAPGSSFWVFNLRTVPYPSQYLLIIDSDGHTLRCGGLMRAVTSINTSSGDTISALERHGGGGVNCLFGDFHVDFVSSQTISNQDTVNCRTGNPWFMMN